MEIVYIPASIIAIGIAGYFWYRSNPISQFNTAKSLMDSDQIAEAASMFEAMLDQHPDAPIKLAECKFRQGIEYLDYDWRIARTFFSQVFDIKRHLSKRSDSKRFEMIEVRTFLEISKLNYKATLVEKPSQNKINHILENIEYMENASQTGFEEEFCNLIANHINDLGGLFYFLGTQEEKASNLVEAIQYYSQALEYAHTCDNENIIVHSSARIGICKLKNKEVIEDSLLEEIDHAPDNIKTDFYFRYAKKLITGQNYADAEKLIQERLNIESPVIEQMKDIIRHKKTEEVIPIINQINQTLDRLYNNTFPFEELKDFYENLDAKIEMIGATNAQAAEKLRQLKPSLFNRLLTNYISEKRYAKAINFIKTYPAFWENLELLKNLSICCFGYVQEGKLDTKNYKTIIAYYLTAVYSDEIMIKSIEQTSWNEDYTFTLAETIGSKNKNRSMLPENVNYENASETNISIGATQKELLHQFEALLLQKVNNPSLIQIIQSFYAFEKESIERIIRVINKDILFASPYFAKSFSNLNEIILAELNEIYLKTRNEDALEAGIPYIKNSSGDDIDEYAQAKELVLSVEEAIKNNDLIKLKTANSDERKELIRKYSGISSKVEDTLFNAIQTKIADNSMNDNLILLMEEAILFSIKKDKLKFQYSNYMSKYCINRTNNGSIDKLKALSLMKNAYTCAPNSSQVCNTLINFIKSNLMDIINNQTNRMIEIYYILDEIYPQRSSAFMQESYELEKTRKDVLRKLQNSGIDVSLLDESILSPITKRQSLNEQGEKVKEALSYFKKMAQ
ncbi:MAG: hypothetical protein LBH32_09595 [Dysgonamonadaceae bacterium]|jgi:hypothetical protein|nr:hypothetical protein [Dysgonamonadaceae bacterium]